MDDMRNCEDWSPSEQLRQVETAIAWQSARFPQVAASIGDALAGLLSARATWNRVESVDAFLDYQTRFAAEMDDRVKGAHLMAFYSHHLAIAAGAILLQTGLVAGLDPDDLAIGWEDASPASLGVPVDGARRFHFRLSRVLGTGDSAAAFHDGFVESLAPVVEALQARTGLSPVAQWRLAGDGIAGAFLELGVAMTETERAMALALAIVEREGSPLASGNLRYERIEAMVDGQPAAGIFRLRSGCCLYYRTPGGDVCDVCVLLDPETQKSRLRARLEHAGG
ncbi:hypothetical protein ASD31_02770 [Rhizobium sp. Root482]|nr:hypothetical protein ASD31_02770 [Rhizobium sp. Root482]